MKIRAFTSFVLIISAAVVAGIVSAGSTVPQSNRLVSMLPASDGVAIFEPKRFLNEALPKVLSANQPMVGEITAKLDEMSTRTGIDLRKFDQVAVGVTMRSVGKSVDADTVAIASGDINAGALIAVGKLASKGTYREEKIGDKTVYVFSPKDLVKNAPVKPNNSKVAEIIEDITDVMTRDVAVAALDRGTIVIGSLPRVRETIEGKSRLAADVSGMLMAKETAIMSFAFKPVAGMKQLLPLDNDELGKNIDSIQYVTGSLDVTAAGASIHAMARTKAASQATSLKETIEGLQALGGIVFGVSKRPDQQVYGRMIKAAKVNVNGTDVTLDLLVPQSDIDILVGVK